MTAAEIREQGEARLQRAREHRRRITAAEAGEQREARLQRAREHRRRMTTAETGEQKATTALSAADASLTDSNSSGSFRFCAIAKNSL